MANNSIIDQIVAAEAFQQLNQLNSDLKKNNTEMSSLLVVVKELNKELGDSNSLSQVTQLVQEQQRATQGLTAAERERQKMLNQIAQLEARRAQNQTEEAKKLELLRQQIAANNRELRNQVQEQQAAEGSIRQISAQLNSLRQAYENLSKAERESAQGQEMRDKIQELSQEYGNLREEMGQTNQAIDKQQGGILSLIGLQNSFFQSMIGLSAATDTLGNRLTASLGPLKAFGKSLWALATNPIVLILAALVAVFKLVSSAISSSVDNTNKFTLILAPLKGILSAVFKIIQAGVGYLLDFVGAISSGIGKAFAAVNKKVEENIQLQKDKIKLDELLIENTVKNAENEVKISKLRAKVAEKDKYSAGERIKMLEEQGELELQNFERNSKFAKEALRLKEIEYSLTESTKEELQELADLQAKVSQTEIEYNQALMQINKRNAMAVAENKRDELDALAARRNAWAVTTEYEAELFKKNADDSKNSLDVRLKNYNLYFKKREQILRSNADLEVKQAEGNKDKERLVYAKLNVELKKLAEDRTKFFTDENKKMSDRILDAQYKIAEIQINSNVDKLKQIADDDKKDYLTRLSALYSYADEREKAIEATAQKEIKTAKRNGILLAEEEKAIFAKRDAELLKLRAERDKGFDNLSKAESEKMINQYQSLVSTRNQMLEKEQSDEEVRLSRAYSQGLINKEEYEKKKAELQIQYSQKQLDAEIEVMSELDLTADQRLKLEQKINDLKFKSAKAANDALIKLADQRRDKEIEVEKEIAEQTKKLREEATEFAKQLLSQSFETRIAELDAEISKVQERKDAELAALDERGVSEENYAIMKAEIEQRAADQTKRLEEQKRAEQKKAAIFQKAWGIAEVGINTAVAVMKVTAQLGTFAAAVIPYIIATGAIQAAAIAAKPIPAYAKGTHDHKGGFAIVGDGGRKEYIQEPSGKIYETPATPTMIDLPKHSIVYKDYASMRNAIASDRVVNYNQSYQETNVKKLEKLTKESVGVQRELINAVRKNRTVVRVYSNDNKYMIK